MRNSQKYILLQSDTNAEECDATEAKLITNSLAQKFL